MNKSKGRALKRNYCYREELKKLSGHVPMKKESKLLRKLMSETGLAEEEIRNRKKYRKMLTEAQKNKTYGFLGGWEKRMKKIMKRATKKTGLAKEHPETQRVFNELWAQQKIRL